MIRVHDIALRITEPKDKIFFKICEKLKIEKSELLGFEIYRESIDARKRKPLRLVYTVDVTVKNEKRILKQFPSLKVTPPALKEILPVSVEQKTRPLVVGFGPAGMFCALYLAQAGLKPIVLERGKSVDERQIDVERFWSQGILNEESNVQFGEGGAGTFSDGKLTSRSKDQRIERVMQTFVKAGAPEEILWTKKPHLGTDRLREIVRQIRLEIESLGGSVRFQQRVTDLAVEGNQVVGVEVNGEELISTDRVCMAIGHSARDTFSWLHAKGIQMEAKAIAVGVRIEHPQAMIDQNQYGEHAGHPKLGAASYALRFTDSSGRGVYSFCMCPGGEVVAAASELGGLVVNGMSEYARDKDNANSAILVQVNPADYASVVSERNNSGLVSPLAGIAFQRDLEQKAFRLGGENYAAPVQLVGSFLGLADLPKGKIVPSYRPKIAWTQLDQILPDFVVSALKEAIPYFGRKIKGFDRPDAVLTAVESRSSSPVRLVRDPVSLESLSHSGLYPIGEGAGYAGGITSSAIDGIRCAEKIVENIQA